MSTHPLMRVAVAPFRTLARALLRKLWRGMRIAMIMMSAVGPAAPPPPLPRPQRTEASAQSDQQEP